MQVKISGETPTQILAHSCAVSPSTSGYQFQFSADGEHFDNWSATTPANETLVVNNMAYGMYIRLSGNTDTVTITY